MPTASRHQQPAHSAASKICSLQRLLKLRAEARAAGRTLVHCHGCFDVVYPGHIHHLQLAKTYGDLLIVSVSADAQVNKGINRPLVPEDLRAQSLAALECVDFVYVNPDPTAVNLLEELRPDVYVKGKEYEHNRDPRFLAEREAITRHGGLGAIAAGAHVQTLGNVPLGADRLLDRLHDVELACTPVRMAS